MKCNFNCLIGYALIGSMFATSFLPKNNTVFREFNQLFIDQLTVANIKYICI